MATKTCPFSGISLHGGSTASKKPSEAASTKDDAAASGRVVGTDSRDPVTTNTGQAASSCPFRRVMGGAAEASLDLSDTPQTSSEQGAGKGMADQPPQLSVKAAAQAAGCPFHAQISEPAEAGAAPETSGKCPFLASAGAQPSTPAGSDAPKCPMGFSSEVQQKLGTFHCILCKYVEGRVGGLICGCHACSWHPHLPRA